MAFFGWYDVYFINLTKLNQVCVVLQLLQRDVIAQEAGFARIELHLPKDGRLFYFLIAKLWWIKDLLIVQYSHLEGGREVFKLLSDKLDIKINTVKAFRDHFDYKFHHRNGYAPKNKKISIDSGTEELDSPFKEIYDKFNLDSFEDLFQTIDSIAFHKLDQRLLTYLKIKAKAKKVTVLKATHKEIAYDLNSSREVVSRLLKQLEKQGGIKLGRNMIDLSKLL